jgi:tetratricopeptide (TPR) repeat protein
VVSTNHSEGFLDLNAALANLLSQGDPDRDQRAAERMVAMAKRYLEQLEGAPVALAARAQFRIFLAGGLLGPAFNGANWPNFFWDVQYAIEQLNKAILELEGSGNRSVLAAAHTTLARAYFLGNAVGPIHLYEPLAIQHAETALGLVDAKANFPLWSEAAFALSLIYITGFTGDRGECTDRAIELLEEVSRGFSDQIGSDRWCDVMNNLGEAYAGRPRGDEKVNFARAIECLEAVAAIEVERHPKGWAKAQVSIGGVWLRQFDVAKALHHYEQAQRVFESTGEYVSGDLLRLYRTMASAYRLIGNRDAQVDFLRKALDRCSPLKKDYDRLGTERLLADALAEGDPLQADRLLRDCLERLIEFPAAIRDHVVVRWSLADLRIKNYQEGQSEAISEAIQFLREAKDLAWDDPRLAWSACQRLGRAYGLADKWPEAARSYEEALDRLELNYRTMLLFRTRGEEFSKTVQVWHDAAYAIVRAGRELDAIKILWSAKARLLREVLRRDHTELERIAVELPLAHRAYMEAAERVRAVEARDRSSGHNALILKSLIDEARNAREALNNAIELIRANPEYSDFLSPLTKIDLPSGPVIVFLVSATSGSLIITVRKHAKSGLVTTVHRVDAITSRDVLAVLGISREASAEKLSADRLCHAVDVLSPSFAGALTEAIPASVSKVTLVPCGLLSILPLHLAWIHRDGWQRRLIDECVVDYALTEMSPSKGILMRPIDPIVGIGDPEFDLAATYDELEAVQIAHPEASLITGADATVSAVGSLIERAGLLHFACHSNLDPNSLYESGLHLADGTLTIGRLLAEYPPKLRAARLVILSSCESAVVDPGCPDQAVGLPAAFIYSGAGTVIATLWPVSDAATAVLMSDFYARLRTTGGQMAADEPARALCESQRWIRKATASELLQLSSVRSEELRELLQTFEPEEAPFALTRHWAAFIVLGG